ncbi:MAG: hypothetical protein SNH35_05345 [Rikenellaceae bacterium]
MDEKIKLTTRTVYDVSPEEMRRMYTTHALFVYQYKRTPDYQEYALRKRLCNDLHRFNEEMSQVCQKNPNNLRLSQIRNIIQRYYGHLKDMVRRDEIDREILQ